ncbi:MAG TPA: hypothetical protein VKQ70_08120 [Caulobacteraceae bacterium]|nr:hypothetical protein [Caulobacteraceae bacterium]
MIAEETMTMSITKDDASQALGEIDAADGRVREMRAYARAAPFLMIWGLVWMGCDLANQFAPQFALAWPIGIAIGSVASFVAGFRLPRTGAADWRYFAVWWLVIGFIVALFFVIPVTSGREIHSVFGLVFGFIYVGMGLWTGWRLPALGVALAALTLIGFYEVTTWYGLYMGLVSGGALFLGGLWLRRV